MNPFSGIFGAVVAVRNSLYDRGGLKIHKLSRPVVSIGNISVGGSGKTPFVIALGDLLKQRGIAFDVLSRGYGRNSSEIAVVETEGSPDRFGDEPLLIAQKLGVPVIVGADRYQAGLLAEKQFDSRLHLLDDGFQHRRLHRDFDIVLLPPEDLQGSLLPMGRLREPLKALRRADAVVVTEAMPGIPDRCQVWRSHRIVTLPRVEGPAIAFCGIAKAQQFFSALKEQGHKLAGHLSFGDHHRYEEADIQRLLAWKNSTNAISFITTEKDLVNLGRRAVRLCRLHIAELRIELEEPEKALSFLLQTIETRSGCRF